MNRPQSSYGGLFQNNKRTYPKLYEKNYQTAYKGFHFLSDNMKKNMRNMKDEIIKNRVFSANAQNQFSLCYPPGSKLRKTVQSDLNVISMVCLEDYEGIQTKKPYELLLMSNLFKFKIK